jgi:AraC-like DNA-binding protein
VHERWFDLTGTHGRLADPSFAEYASMSLATLTLEGGLFHAFERLLTHFARLVEGQAVPETLPQELESLHDKLVTARAPEVAWQEATRMVDERMGRAFSTRDVDDTLNILGLEKRPERVAVGLLSGPRGNPDPLDVLIRRDSFQRACVSLARRRGDALSGKVGDHGVVLLQSPASTTRRTRSRLADFVAKSQALAGNFGLRLHVGVGSADEPSALADDYRGALFAAEMALSRGAPIVYGAPHPLPAANRLRQLRAAFVRDVAERPALLAPRFDRYIEAAFSHSGYRVESARAHLWAGLERLAEPLLACGALDEKELDEHGAAIERAANAAGTLASLADAYRHVVADIVSALGSPTRARRDRATERAVGFVREHYAEPLTLRQVARVAGFAPDYFSRMFRRDEGRSFASYLMELRLERVKQLLGGSSLGLARIGQMSGFRSPTLLHRVFKRAVGMTPAAYRASSRS